MGAGAGAGARVVRATAPTRTLKWPTGPPWPTPPEPAAPPWRPPPSPPGPAVTAGTSDPRQHAGIPFPGSALLIRFASPSQPAPPPPEYGWGILRLEIFALCLFSICNLLLCFFAYKKRRRLKRWWGRVSVRVKASMGACLNSCISLLVEPKEELRRGIYLPAGVVGTRGELPLQRRQRARRTAADCAARMNETGERASVCVSGRAARCCGGAQRR